MTDQTAQNIQATIDSNPVVLFMKGSKKMPQCGFSSAVVNALSYLEVDFKDVYVLEDGDLGMELKYLVIGRLFHNFISKVNLLEVAILLKKCLNQVSLVLI